MSSPDLTSEQNQEIEIFHQDIESFDKDPGWEMKAFIKDWIEEQIPQDRLRSLDLNAMTIREDLERAIRDGFRPQMKGLFIVATYLVGDDLWETTL